jgi:hypothetical protein
MIEPNRPWPSKQLQDALNSFETSIQKKTHEGIPEWMIMAAGLIAAYDSFKTRKELHILFDLNNPFDYTMFIWCLEANRRKRIAQEKASKPDPSRN